MNFDFNQAKEYSDFEPLPDGEYPAHIESAEWGDSKSGNGKYLKLVFGVEGRKVFEYLNLINDNQQARDIAMGKAKSILSAVGYTTFNFANESMLAQAFQGQLMLKLGNKTEEYQGEARKKNTIKKFMPMAAKPSMQDKYSSSAVPF